MVSPPGPTFRANTTSSRTRWNSHLPGSRDQVQFTDWRLMGGFRFEAGWLTTFIEAGGVFGREVEFRRNGEDFDVDPGFIMRAGFRY